MKLKLRAGDILLTSGVGGTEANFRDRILTKSIIFNQKIQCRGFNPTRSHAELIVDDKGSTFAARWRTRIRENGLVDYLNSNITIGRSLSLNQKLFNIIWIDSELWRWDGNVYPIHRLIMQLIGTWIFPWMVKIGGMEIGVCSEVVAKFYHTAHKLISKYYFVENGWRGITPADIEREIRYGDEFEIIFDGKLTREIINKSRLNLYQFERRENERND